MKKCDHIIGIWYFADESDLFRYSNIAKHISSFDYINFFYYCPLCGFRFKGLKDIYLDLVKDYNSKHMFYSFVDNSRFINDNDYKEF